MDSHTLDLLEFNKVRELLAGYTACSLGKELARQLEPGKNLESIREELALVSEMVDALAAGQSPPLGGLHDVRMVVRRAAIGAALTADQLLEVAETLNCTGNIYRYRSRLPERLERLADLLSTIEDLGMTAKAITACIDSRGHVLDLASRELGLVRQKLANVDDRVQGEIRKLLRDPKLREILRYPNATVSGDHYVLPVAINHRQKIPGVIHRTSATGETVFIEPASIANLSSERALLKGEEEREIRKVLRRLSGEVGKVARPLTFALEVMARVDLITAKARFSRDYKMFAPEINEEGRLWLRMARHPVLEHLFRTPPAPPAEGETGTTEIKPKRDVVPIDIRMGYGFNLLIITGPNTGGKTVCLKTTGLLSLMALSGMHIPAGEGSCVPRFSRILADIGDEQSLEQSLSTFSSHISRIASILRIADENSLVLLDELGAGTDPTEGAALGRAILDGLDKVRCRGMVTTHLGDLKTYAFNNDRAENAAVEFNVETLRPTYRLMIGQFGMSNALQIARRLKLPRELLRRAHHYLKRKQKRAPEMIQLQKLREETEKAREEALRAQHEAEVKAEHLHQESVRLTRAAEEANSIREARLRLQPNDSVHVAKFDKVGRIIRLDHRRNIAVVSVGIGQWEVSMEEIFPTDKH